MDQDSSQTDLFHKVIPLPLEEEIKHSYLDYAMSVIVGRALPDARDGLKPVQRRVLYAMLELGLRHNQAFKKSARVVGETMGKYHPHGDAAIYETMARLSQDFSLRYPLVDGQGNFGSIDGDPPAAMRYTEARLHSLGEEMLADIDEETVNWGPNFDESLQEPLVLPSRVPNLLVNGSTGIAVGMATNMPPHNLREVIDATCALLEDPQIELGELMALLPGPDFPTGGVILGRDGIVDAYKTGRGKVIVRGCADIEDGRRGRKAIVITEIPYMVNKTSLIETIAKGAQSGHLDGITDLRDESNREGIRVVLELHRDADPNLVLRQLYSRTQLQSTFGVINLALVDGRPRVLTLHQILQVFLDHRRAVVRRRTEHRLRKAEERAHIVEGLVRALDLIDQVIALIRSASDPASAKAALVETLGFSEVQAQAILDMRLQRLTGLERSKLEEELAQLLQDIERYRSILANPSILDGVVRGELQEIRAAYEDDRRTRIEDAVEDVSAEDLIPESEIVVVLSRDGFLRRMPLQDYRCQSRGGKGVKGASTRGEDEIALVTVTTTHRTLYLFTSRGRVFAIRGFTLPEPKTGKGKHVSTFVSLEEGERVVTLRDSRLDGARFVFFVTQRGVAKRLPVTELDGINRAGRRILGLAPEDTIARVRFTGGEDELLLTTAQGQTLRVPEGEFRPQGRTAHGVRGVRLDEGDLVVGCDVIEPGRQVLFISERGIGKRTPYDEFTAHHRGGGGVRAMKLVDRTGDLVGAWGVREDDELVVISAKGRMVRLLAGEISSLGRAATGYKVVRLDEGDEVADVSIIRCADLEEE
ncbi:DNA gyrase subunit A [Aminomonas paucivorans DSM 12260]|uniref:DNA gyrase subunit A n=1 Tax=Aminomonas paucivorans DSM 12260 TaxID=584708 RepID=E3CZ44_9BACT|nr:DNA gyrase subunit A [Aminomonas paucivorans]EFQ22817.1 DNA gyrase subunit A [Aminomonas paucivorans DSM 12260]